MRRKYSLLFNTIHPSECLSYGIKPALVFTPVSPMCSEWYSPACEAALVSHYSFIHPPLHTRSRASSLLQ